MSKQLCVISTDLYTELFLKSAEEYNPNLDAAEFFEIGATYEVAGFNFKIIEKTDDGEFTLDFGEIDVTDLKKAVSSQHDEINASVIIMEKTLDSEPKEINFLKGKVFMIKELLQKISEITGSENC